MQQASDNTIQERYYNGWKKDHYVFNLIVFALDWTIPMMAIDAPGNIYESKVAEYGWIYTKLELLLKNMDLKQLTMLIF